MRMSYAVHEDDDHAVLGIGDAIAYVDAVMTAIALEEDLEMDIVTAAGTSAPPAPDAADAPVDDKRAERIARLARFFDPSISRPDQPV